MKIVTVKAPAKKPAGGKKDFKAFLAA